MYCSKCGSEIFGNPIFCPSCGANLDSVKVEEKPVYQNVANNNEGHVAGVWRTFAKLAKVFGIVSICICWIPIFGFMAWAVSIPGIVFGSLGRNKGAASATVKSNGTIGMILSILSTVGAFLFYIIFIILLIG